MIECYYCGEEAVEICQVCGEHVCRGCKDRYSDECSWCLEILAEEEEEEEE